MVQEQFRKLSNRLKRCVSSSLTLDAKYVRLSLIGKAEVLKISSNRVSDVPVQVRGRTPKCRSRSAGGALAWKASSPL